MEKPLVGAAVGAAEVEGAAEVVGTDEGRVSVRQRKV